MLFDFFFADCPIIAGFDLPKYHARLDCRVQDTSLLACTHVLESFGDIKRSLGRWNQERLTMERGLEVEMLVLLLPGAKTDLPF